MADFAQQTCVVCGAQASHFVASEDLRFDEIGEVVDVTKDKSSGRYYCDAHLPHLHVEPLEDRLD